MISIRCAPDVAGCCSVDISRPRVGGVDDSEEEEEAVAAERAFTVEAFEEAGEEAGLVELFLVRFLLLELDGRGRCLGMNTVGLSRWNTGVLLLAAPAVAAVAGRSIVRACITPPSLAPAALMRSVSSWVSTPLPVPASAPADKAIGL